jgi:fructose-1,6-bisphosphatase
MTLVLEITPELEKQIRQAASSAGTPIDRYILESVIERLVQTQHTQNKPSQNNTGQNTGKRLSSVEVQLLEKINQSLAQIQWDRYRELLARRKAGTLTLEEQRELISYSDRIEEANVKRIRYVAELADVQHTTLPALMTKLGLKPVAHAE